MGLFDNVTTPQNAGRSAANFNNAAAVGTSYYAPELQNYQSQLASQIAQQSAAGQEYAARGSQIFDDADTKRGQLNLESAGFPISRDANTRQLIVLQQLQQLANQNKAAGDTFIGQNRDFAYQGRGIDTQRFGLQRGEAARQALTAKRGENSDATTRGATLSAGHSYALGDIQKSLAAQMGLIDVDDSSSNLGLQKTLAQLANDQNKLNTDHQADEIERYNQINGVRDSNSRLDLDTVNNALQRQAVDRNAATAAAIQAAQKRAADAQFAAAMSAIQTNRSQTNRGIVGDAATAAGG